MKPKLFFFVNVDWFFISHRLPIALQAIRDGYEVHLATRFTEYGRDLEDLGIKTHPVDIDRRSNNPFSETKALLQIIKTLRAVRPDILHVVTIKPTLLGGIAARLTCTPAMVVAISGLGYAFTARGIKPLLYKFIATHLYKVALKQKHITAIFQNEDDRSIITELTGLSKKHTVLIRGSGVDLTKFAPTTSPETPAIVLFAARLLKDKGVLEFVQAANMIKARRPSILCRFVLVGDIDTSNPRSLTTEELEDLRKNNNIEIWGRQAEMEAIIARAEIVVLPSYREGLPKVLIEAAACGRSVITTDVPGCRDAIERDLTGILVPPRDANSLADAIMYLLDNPSIRSDMGKSGRRLAESEFSILNVVNTHLQIYKELLSQQRKSSLK